MAHIWNFHALNFYNDFRRFANCNTDLLETIPLGSGAITGTHLDIDLTSIANQLGFQRGPINSIHGTSDRDWLIEVSQKISICALHVSRLCEDIIFLSSSPVQLIELPTDWSSGSSMMPNKRNPDFFEIVRAKSKRLIALNTEILTLNLGIASGYSSDFHEQKRSIVKGVRELQEIASAFGRAILGIKLNQTRAEELLEQGHILATDIANELVKHGRPFREAYSEVASRICAAQFDSKQIGRPETSFESSVENRNNLGGTSRKRVLESIHLLRSYFAEP